jgi:hypothetical protein
MSYTSNRLYFMFLMSLGASSALRRIWLWGCIVMLAVAGVTVLASGYSPTNRTGNDLWFTIGALFGVFGLMGLGIWLIASVIRFVGKNVKDDYRSDRLFER